MVASSFRKAPVVAQVPSAPTHSERSQRYEICECFQTPGVSSGESFVCVYALGRYLNQLLSKQSVVTCSPSSSIIQTDIPQITPKFVEIVRPSHRQGNCIPFAAIRCPDFGNRPALGRPFVHFSRHPDTPLVSLSPRRRFPRPTPARVFVAIHRPAAGFPETGSGARRLRPIGT